MEYDIDILCPTRIDHSEEELNAAVDEIGRNPRTFRFSDHSAPLKVTIGLEHMDGPRAGKPWFTTRWGSDGYSTDQTPYRNTDGNALRAHYGDSLNSYWRPTSTENAVRVASALDDMVTAISTEVLTRITPISVQEILTELAMWLGRQSNGVVMVGSCWYAPETGEILARPHFAGGNKDTR